MTVCAQTPDEQPAIEERPATCAYVERRQGDLRKAITDYVVSSQRELRDQIGMLQAQIADLSVQVEETAALLLNLEKRTRQ